jgi:hypothetical protein
METIQKADSAKKIRNHRHAMIRHQNALAMFLTGIHPLNVHHFEYFQGGEFLL